MLNNNNQSGNSRRVQEILRGYQGENIGVLTNLARLLNTGKLAGTGKLVILPVDQGFEHGPARSFASNPAGYSPSYHYQLAISAGCNAYAAPYGFLNSVGSEFAGSIPLILKMNNSDSISSGEPLPAITSSVKDALQIGASAVGLTIYPGSGFVTQMYEQAREIIQEARQCGLPVVIWSYPRGKSLSKEGETAMDIVTYAAHIACQLGAHIVKVKPPTAHIEQMEAKKVYSAQNIPTEHLVDRIRHVVQGAFNGQRIVIFSGGVAKGDNEVLEEVRAIHQGGGFGSIIGRNAFQRSEQDGIKLLNQAMDVYLET